MNNGNVAITTTQHAAATSDFCSVPCYGKAIVDAREFYTDYLTTIMTPLIYEGYKSLYRDAKDNEKLSIEAAKNDSAKTKIDATIIFQGLVRDIRNMNNNKIERETARIRDSSTNADIFDDLIRCVIKSHIAVLICTSRNPLTIKNNFHETVDINNFVHRCYVESAPFFYDNPMLFYRTESTPVSDVRDNRNKIFELIKLGIKNAIKRTLPLSKILREYLETDVEEINAKYMENMRAMILKDIYGIVPEVVKDTIGKMVTSASEHEPVKHKYGYGLPNMLDDTTNSTNLDLHNLVYGQRPKASQEHRPLLKSTTPEKKTSELKSGKFSTETETETPTPTPTPTPASISKNRDHHTGIEKGGSVNKSGISDAKYARHADDAMKEVFTNAKLGLPTNQIRIEDRIALEKKEDEQREKKPVKHDGTPHQQSDKHHQTINPLSDKPLNNKPLNNKPLSNKPPSDHNKPPLSDKPHSDHNKPRSAHSDKPHSAHSDKPHSDKPPPKIFKHASDIQ